MLSFPRPVVVACTGHAYAMGAFLVLSGDYRVGAADAEHRITANEVAIGMTLPHAAIQICRQRLTRSHFERATNLAEVFGTDAAVEAGWLDEVFPLGGLPAAARRKAVALTALDAKAHADTKARSRRTMLDGLQAAIERDDSEFLAAIASLAQGST